MCTDNGSMPLIYSQWLIIQVVSRIFADTKTAKKLLIYFTVTYEASY